MYKMNMTQHMHWLAPLGNRTETYNIMIFTFILSVSVFVSRSLYLLRNALTCAFKIISVSILTVISGLNISQLCLNGSIKASGF